MRRLRAWLARFGELLGRARRDGELSAELESHVALHVADNLRAGMAPEEARRQALLKLGGLEQAKELCRERGSIPLLETLWRDVRYGLRLLGRSPGFAAIAVITLALGIGANTAIFSLLDSVLLRMLPVRDPQQLVQVRYRAPGSSDTFVNGVRVEATGRTFTNPLWEQLRDHQDAFSDIFAWSPSSFDLANGGESQFVDGAYVSGSYFPTLGVRAAIGRLLAPTDDFRGCPGAAVLDYGFWRQHYAGQPNAVGGSILLNGHLFPIVGVVQSGFNGLDVGEKFQVVLPICAAPIDRMWNRSLLDNRSAWWLLVVGRLKPGVSDKKATDRLNVLAPEIFGAAVPLNWPPAGQAKFRQQSFLTVPAATGVAGFNSDLRAEYERPLELLLTLVGLVLLIACANIASLLLARSSGRQREIALRFSLGASRARLVRQMLAESVLLSGAGTLLGILFARWAEPLLVRLVSTHDEFLYFNLSLDGRVLAFTLALAVLTVLLFGIWPALRSTRVSLTGAMKGSDSRAGISHSQFRSGRSIVVVQVALSLVILVGTGLFLRTFRNLLALDPGFDRNNVLLVSLRIYNAGIPAGSRLAFYDQALARLKSIPGADSVSQVWFAPFTGAGWNDDIKIDGYQPPVGVEPLCWFDWITPGYFSTMRTRLLAGRSFNPGDTAASQPVAIVNETFARRFFPGANPLAHYFHIPEAANPSAVRPMRIVGVVEDSKYGSLREAAFPFAYVPLAQMQSVPEESSFVIRTAANPGSLVPAVRDAVAAMNRSASLSFTTLAQQVDESLLQERLLASLSGFFGALALLLTAIGLYGAMAYAVGRRTREIGIRMALGAHKRSILGMVMAEIARLLAFGVAAGVLVAFWAARFTSHFLFGVTPGDWKTMVFAAAALAAIAILAGYLPARRAAQVDPMAALRQE